MGSSFLTKDLQFLGDEANAFLPGNLLPFALPLSYPFFLRDGGFDPDRKGLEGRTGLLDRAGLD